MGSLSNRYIQGMNLTNRPSKHTQFYILDFFQVSGSDKAPIPLLTKLRFVLTLPFTLHPLVGLMHNSTNAKEQQNGPVNALKKRVHIISITPGSECFEKREKIFCVCPRNYHGVSFLSLPENLHYKILCNEEVHPCIGFWQFLTTATKESTNNT